MWILILLTLLFSTSEANTWETITLFDFNDPTQAEWWFIVDDGVMGGVSQGQWNAEDDYAVFSGFVSLDNNGGFSSVRSQFRPVNMSDFDGVMLKLRGDGNVYSFNLEDTHSRNSYRITFQTEVMDDTEWQTVLVPFDELTATRFGRILPNASPIDLTAVRTMSILISDKQEGDFRLEIVEVSVYKGDAEKTTKLPLAKYFAD